MQVLLPLVLVQAVVIAGMAWTAQRHLSRVTDVLVEQEVERLARKVGTAGRAAEDMAGVMRFVEHMERGGAVRFLGLVEDGRMMVGEGDLDDEAVSVLVAMTVMEAGGSGLADGLVRKARGGMVGVGVPVLAGTGEQVLGAVVAVVDRAPIAAEVRARNAWLVWLMGVLWALSVVVVALAIYRRVIRRLGQLAGAVERIEEGGLRWRPSGLEDEINRLGRRLERALAERRDTDQRFKRLAENARDILYRHEVSPVPRFSYMSSAVTSVLGVNPEELYANPRRVLEMVHPEDRERLECMYSGNVPEEPFELRWMHADGHVVWTEQVHVVHRDPSSGRVVTVEGIARDVTARHEAEQAREVSESLVLEVADATPALMWITDDDGLIRWVNARWLEHTGRTLEQELGEGWLECVHPDDRAFVRESWYSAVRSRAHYEKEYRLRRHDGTWHWFLDVGRPRRDREGRVVGYIGALLDVTARRQAEERLRQVSAVFSTTRDAVFVTDAAQRITSVNQAFEEMTGYTESEMLGRSAELLWSDQHSPQARAEMSSRLTEDGQWQGEVWHRRKSGEIFPGWISVNAITDDAGAVTHRVHVLTDTSRLKRQEQRLEHLAHYDALTGLPNRLLLSTRLKRSIERARRKGRQLAIYVIDLDRFKMINESLGHGIGDALLQRIVGRLETTLGPGDTLARIGGDEFLLLREGHEGLDEASRLAEQLLSRFADAVHLPGGREVYLGASIGISVYPEHGEDATELLRNADAAMFAAKQAGRRTYRFYTRALTAAVESRLDMETRLRRALEETGLALRYQPLVETLTGRPLGVEALVRWSDPVLGDVSPEAFIPVAEDSALIAGLGRFVLRTACAQMQSWREEGVPIETLSVNLSPHQLHQPDLVDTVRDALERTGLPPVCLELEITESALVENHEEIEATLHALKALGLRIVIDDFGTGYSSLAYLRRFPVDKLKIDRSFMAGVPHDESAVEIAATIVAMARGLRLDVVAEGIENEAQLTFLQEHGCPIFQGYLHSAPIPASEVPGLFAPPAEQPGT